jgi:hypothetical protein
MLEAERHGPALTGRLGIGGGKLGGGLAGQARAERVIGRPPDLDRDVLAERAERPGPKPARARSRSRGRPRPRARACRA